MEISGSNFLNLSACADSWKCAFYIISTTIASFAEYFAKKTNQEPMSVEAKFEESQKLASKRRMRQATRDKRRQPRG